MIVELARDRLVGRAHDGAGLPGRQTALRLIDQRAGFLDDAVGMVDGLRHAVVADREVDQRTRRLGAIVSVGGNLDRSHRVEFGACALVGQSDRNVSHHRVVRLGHLLPPECDDRDRNNRHSSTRGERPVTSHAPLSPAGRTLPQNFVLGLENRDHAESLSRAERPPARPTRPLLRNARRWRSAAYMTGSAAVVTYPATRGRSCPAHRHSRMQRWRARLRRDIRAGGR